MRFRAIRGVLGTRSRAIRVDRPGAKSLPDLRRRIARERVPTMPRFRAKSSQKRLSSAPGLWLVDTMDLEVESRVICPYCGAIFTTVVDTSSGTFTTIEDCEVCCRPIEFNVHCHYGEIESVEFDRA